MLALQNVSELCWHCLSDKCMNTDPFLPRTLAEDVAVLIFEQLYLNGAFHWVHQLFGHWNMHDDKVHYGVSSCGPWFYSALARNLLPFKVFVSYDPLRVLIPMSIFAWGYLCWMSMFLHVLAVSFVACTSRTNQIKRQLVWKFCWNSVEILLDLWDFLDGLVRSCKNTKILHGIMKSTEKVC